MKITALETIRLQEFPNIIWVRVHTDQGVTGLGETFFGAATVEAYLHESAAPLLLGKNPLEIERRAKELVGYLGWRSTGAEARGNSAIDIALWDLFGKVHGQPLYQMFGGRARDKIRVYNTCAGYKYIRDTRAQKFANYGLGVEPGGPYEDLEGFLHHADQLAFSLAEQGITGMKIWPFDEYAERWEGMYITPDELEKALMPFRKIRDAVGMHMDIMVEFHSMWNLPTAQHIAHALEEFGTFWHEDPIRMDSLADLKAYAAHSKAPICASETLSSKWAFRDLLDTGSVGIVMLDVAWCGGLTEARKIAAMADAYHLPVAPHDCTGPIVWTASTHLSMHAPNALIQESVRAFYTGWYKELVTDLPRVEHGFITVPEGPGLGIELLPDLPKRPDAIVRRSAL